MDTRFEIRRAGWRDCLFLYRLRLALQPNFSLLAHIRWFAWRKTIPRLWIITLHGRPVATLRIDTIAGLRWYSCQRDPRAAHGPGGWSMRWLEQHPEHHPVYGIIGNDNVAGLRLARQPPWVHLNMGLWTLVRLGEDEAVGSTSKH